jgi:O-antigen/teichoic acid export membrane protein
LSHLKRIRGNPYLAGVFVLATGTAISQAIPILVSPILTRLYGPADFGLLALFMALVSSVGMAVSGRYDMAMLLPKKEVVARQLLGLTFWVACLFSIAYFCLIGMASDTIRKSFGAEALGNWIYLVPLALFLTGMRTTLGYWANREGDFRVLAKVQLSQAVVVTLISLLFGVLGTGFPGLLTANLLGLLCGVVLLFYLYRHDLRLTTMLWSRPKVVLARRFKNYPLYSASSAILDGVTMSLPVFFFAHYFSGSVLGYYALVLRVANAPLSFVSSAVGQVHMKKMIDLIHAKGDVRSYLISLTGGLTMAVLVPVLLLMPIAPWFFSCVFGAEWREAGIYLQILMPSLAVRFVVSTMSGTIEVTNNSHLGAVWKVTALVFTSIVFLSIAPMKDIYQLLVAMMITDIGLYFFYYYLLFRAGMNPRVGAS